MDKVIMASVFFVDCIDAHKKFKDKRKIKRYLRTKERERQTAKNATPEQRVVA